MNKIPVRHQAIFRPRFVSFAGGIAFLVGVTLAGSSPQALARQTGKKPVAAPAKAPVATTATLADFYGQWQGRDGVNFTIRDASGTGADFDTGTASVSGARAILDAAKGALTIRGLLRVQRTWKITDPPKIAASGRPQTTLGGVVFERIARVEKDTSVPPPADEIKRLTDSTLLRFTDAVQTKNFKGFRNAASKMLRDDATADRMNEVFAGFRTLAPNIANAVKTMVPTRDPAPAIDPKDGTLVVFGAYPTKPSRLSYKTRYINEEGVWKLLFINVEVTPVEEKKP